MKRAAAIVSGIVVGLLLAGLVAPALIWILPPRLRGANAVWGTAAAVVALTTWGFWAAFNARRD